MIKQRPYHSVSALQTVVRQCPRAANWLQKNKVKINEQIKAVSLAEQDSLCNKRCVPRWVRIRVFSIQKNAAVQIGAC